MTQLNKVSVNVWNSARVLFNDGRTCFLVRHFDATTNYLFVCLFSVGHSYHPPCLGARATSLPAIIIIREMDVGNRCLPQSSCPHRRLSPRAGRDGDGFQTGSDTRTTKESNTVQCLRPRTWVYLRALCSVQFSLLCVKCFLNKGRIHCTVFRGGFCSLQIAKNSIEINSTAPTFHRKGV